MKLFADEFGKIKKIQDNQTKLDEPVQTRLERSQSFTGGSLTRSYSYNLEEIEKEKKIGLYSFDEI